MTYKLCHSVLRLTSVPVGKLITELLKLHSTFHDGLHRAVSSAYGILMSGLAFQKNILYLAITVAIHFAVLLYITCRNLTLHITRFFCVTANIVELFPLHQVITHRLSVEKDHWYITLPCRLDDICRCGSVYKIHTQHIAACIYHLINYLVLLTLIIITASHRYYHIHICGLHSLKIGFHHFDHGIYEWIICCISDHPDSHGFV